MAICTGTTWRLAGVLALGLLGTASSAPQAQTPPAQQPAPPQGRGGRGAPPPTSGLGGAGPADKPAVDAAAADSGRPIFERQCASCHGSDARGTPTGSNLVRSLVVLRDRYGSELGPYLAKGHPTPGTKPPTEEQVVFLAHFLRQRVNDALRGSPLFAPGDVLVGDARAGEAFFNGAGKCASCHSPSGDLAGIGTRYRPIDLQQRAMFPRTGRGRGRGGAGAAGTSVPRATVTPSDGAAVTGAVMMLDDFNVMIRDDSGVVHSFRRTPDLKVQKNDPLAAHVALLETITDEQMHDVVAYLETLK
jgi:mono/diheme cytochrome c family protein